PLAHRRARRTKRSRSLRSAYRPAAPDVAEELGDARESVERVRRQVIVGVAAERSRAARFRRVIARARERGEPDKAIGRALQPRRLLLEPRRVAALPAVGDE